MQTQRPVNTTHIQETLLAPCMVSAQSMLHRSTAAGRPCGHKVLLSCMVCVCVCVCVCVRRVMVHGYALNHTALSAHAMRTPNGQPLRLEEAARLVTAHGLTLNQDGGTLFVSSQICTHTHTYELLR